MKVHADAGASSCAQGVRRQPVIASVVIPAFNEEASIERCVAEAVGVLDRIGGRHEVVVVDDGSHDRTWEILEDLAAREPRLRPIRHLRNRGVRDALQTLIEASTGRYIYQTGADGQWRMDEIERMLPILEDGADVVIGVRRNKQYTSWRKLQSFAFNSLVALAWGQHFGDIGSVNMARACLWKQIPVGSRTAFFQAERLIVAARGGARIVQIEVEHLPREGGKSTFGSPRRALESLAELLAFRIQGRRFHHLAVDWREREDSSGR